MPQRFLIELPAAQTIFVDVVPQAYQLANIHPSPASGDGNPVEMPPFEIIPGIVPDLAAGQNLGAVDFVQTFQAAGHVHRVAQDGIRETFRRAYIADENFAAVEPHSGAKSNHLSILPLRKFLKPDECGPAGEIFMVEKLLRSVEKTKQAVPDEFIDGSGMLAQPARENLEVGGQLMDENIGRDLFAVRGKSLDIGKENRKPPDFASENGFLSGGKKPAHEIVGDLRRGQPPQPASGNLTLGCLSGQNRESRFFIQQQEDRAMDHNRFASRKVCVWFFALTAGSVLLLGMRPVNAQTVGACITKQGTCEWTVEQDCVDSGRTYLGDAATCDEGDTTGLTPQSQPTGGGALCCRYANVGATPEKPCKEGLTCPTPGTPIVTDIRCEVRKCPNSFDLRLFCLNSNGMKEPGHKCTREVTGPTCGPCKTT